ALIIAFIAVVVIIAMVFLQGKISNLFSKVGNSLGTYTRSRWRRHQTSPPGENGLSVTTTNLNRFRQKTPN
ncbi:MAG: Flp family type IVb pilin, partial [Thermomicrobiales bacterium]